ncbi:MAG TPA: hypothetical protein VIJ41_04900 [Candidatus Nanopelagicales bacterium]
MTNPTPRPALRKAADADVHPAAPRPSRSPRARQAPVTVAPVPEPVPEAEDVADVADGGVTVEAVAVEAVSVGAVTDVPATVAAPSTRSLKPPKKRHADPGRPARATKRMFSGSTSDHLRVPEVQEVTSSQRAALDHLFENDDKAKKPKAPKPVDLMGGKLVDLEASVPKNLRKAARDEARKRGLDVDTVVTDLLHAWLTERR